VSIKVLLYIAFGLLLTLLVTSTGCQSDSHSGQAAIPQNIPQDLMVTLERTVCFGTCPDYKLTITSDGVVVLEGRHFVKREGATIKSAISQERLKQLMEEFDRVKFFSLEDDYSDDRRVCDELWTDNPSAFTSIRINGKSKTVKHYHGCRGPKVPKELTELENNIDKIVNTAQWLPDQKEQ
jgi:Domain of unknown function (DUF6438)